MNGCKSLEFKLGEAECAEGILLRANRLIENTVEGETGKAGKTGMGKVMMRMKFSAKWTFIPKTC